jgi:hypothetical protein
VKHIVFCREFTKKIDPLLPFFHPSGTGRYREEDQESHFDLPGAAHPPRLHDVVKRRREDGSLFVPGRATLAAKGSKSVRDRFFRFDVGMPPVPPEKPNLNVKINSICSNFCRSSTVALHDHPNFLTTLLFRPFRYLQQRQVIHTVLSLTNLCDTGK